MSWQWTYSPENKIYAKKSSNLSVKYKAMEKQADAHTHSGTDPFFYYKNIKVQKIALNNI
jgi:hypothetical protein